jgi:GNAT superfamily N-acetyltransferase
MAAYFIRDLTAEDIPAGMALKQFAGWNQTRHDWEMLLHVSEGGNFAAVVDDTVVGTITTVSYSPHFSWLGMLLVHPDFRRRGIGTHLMKKALEFAQVKGAVRLDATPAGRQKYLKQGFKEEYRLVRMICQETDWIGPEFPTVKAIPSSVLPDICHYDVPVFGANRNTVLSEIYQKAPQYAFYAKFSDASPGRTAISGYCLGRHGSDFEQIGPIIADDIKLAKKLLVTALQLVRGKSVIIDVPVDKFPWLQEIEKLGFKELRSYSRMIYGSQQVFGQLEKQYAITGPEIG